MLSGKSNRIFEGIMLKGNPRVVRRVRISVTYSLVVNHVVHIGTIFNGESA
jgi:hypothetical protein